MLETDKLISNYLNEAVLPVNIREICLGVVHGTRLTVADANLLYSHADMGLLGMLAQYVCQKLNGDHVYFNRNFHIEPTNHCFFSCTFCSYRRDLGQEGSWLMSLEDIKRAVEAYRNSNATEVHVTGGVHPKWNLDYYCKIIQTIKSVMPSIHVKAFSAVELDYVFNKSKIQPQKGLQILKDAGLDSIPGGGAEISDPEIRSKMCEEKASWASWLEIHRRAHELGIPSNATMLYGHYESYMHRALHMSDIRDLQDSTGGFNCFIPLKFKAANNSLAFMSETDTLEDMRNYAVCRIFLDNIKHVKAYWPMLGKSQARLSLSFGVDDLDGTIDDSTKIYSMAGADDQNPSMSVDELCATIRSVGKKPVERDSVYNPIRFY